jgi:hypothetical protein
MSTTSHNHGVAPRNQGTTGRTAFNANPIVNWLTVALPVPPMSVHWAPHTKPSRPTIPDKLAANFAVLRHNTALAGRQYNVGWRHLGVEERVLVCFLYAGRLLRQHSCSSRVFSFSR